MVRDKVIFVSDGTVAGSIAYAGGEFVAIIGEGLGADVSAKGGVDDERQPINASKANAEGTVNRNPNL
jgi:hypothetical protein